MIVPLLITAAACFGACYFAATHSALKTFSRKRLLDLLELRNQPHRAQVLQDRLGELLLTTGLLRSCLGLVVVLSTLYLIKIELGPQAGASVWPYVGAFLIASLLLGVFTVAIPGSWAEYRTERLLAWSIPLLRIVSLILRPITIPLSLFDPMVRRISGVDLQDDDDDLSDQVLAAVEDHEEGEHIAEEQKAMIEAIFDLHDTDAARIMTPRTDIQGLELTATLDEVKHAVIEFGHSRLPVYRENLDEIVGILYAKDLLPLLDHPPAPAPRSDLSVSLNENSHADAAGSYAAAPPFELQSLLRKPFLIPESKRVLELLHEFQSTKIHLAVVLDEYGGTAGLITIEDILEEIVGEIQDEYEPEDDAPVFVTVDENTARVDARTHIDDLNDRLNLDLPEDEDYDTVGGFVFAELGHIPDPGESFEAHGIKVTVDEAERTKVIAVTVEKLSLTAEQSAV